MRNVFAFLLLMLFMSCGAPQDKSADTAKAAPLSTGLSDKKVDKDTIPKPARKANRNNYILDSSRPETEIDHRFPFDIDLKNAEGEIVNSADVLKNNGKPTVLLFWLTTCYPCRIEMAAIEKEMPKWTKEADFNIVAISTDFKKNYPNFVKRVKENSWPWKVYNDVNREFRKVMPGQLNGLPQTFIFDKNGAIVYHKRKYATGDEQKLFAKIKELVD